MFIDAVAAAGHRPHIVKICADGFQDPGCDVRFMLAHRQVALHLQAVGLPVTYLAAATYMETLIDAADQIRTTGEVRAGPGRPLTSPWSGFGPRRGQVLMYVAAARYVTAGQPRRCRRPAGGRA